MSSRIESTKLTSSVLVARSALITVTKAQIIAFWRLTTSRVARSSELKSMTSAALPSIVAITSPVAAAGCAPG